MIRIHASYHKCLTMYFLRTVSAALNRYSLSRGEEYEHFESIEGLFHNQARHRFLCSINGFAPKLAQLPEDFRMTRFVRDPRDLVVSGYFYHKRGAEPWFRFKTPTEKYWAAINGHVPPGMPAGCSFAEYLGSLDLEDGLRAEMDFRKYQLESMMEWEDDPRIKVFRYEDVMEDQAGAFREMLNHLEIYGWRRWKILHFARKFSISRQRADKHIRNPNAGQWRTHFTERLNADFLESYAPILARHGYETK